MNVLIPWFRWLWRGLIVVLMSDNLIAKQASSELEIHKISHLYDISNRINPSHGFLRGIVSHGRHLAGLDTSVVSSQRWHEIASLQGNEYPFKHSTTDSKIIVLSLCPPESWETRFVRVFPSISFRRLIDIFRVK